MRRTLFYLSVALLAFGIGSFVVFKFYWVADKEQIIAQQNQIADETQTEKYFGKGLTEGKVTVLNKSDEPVDVPKLQRATCSDENIRSVWNELLTDEEFQESAKRFYDKADCSDMLHIQKTDLNDDWQKEIILSGNNSNLCDAAFSCLYWIFEKKHDNYKQILRSRATGYNQIANYKKKRGIEISKTKSNGYRTIILRGGANYQTFQFTFQFEKNKYVEKECLTFDYVNNNEDWIRTCQEAWKE